MTRRVLASAVLIGVVFASTPAAAGEGADTSIQGTLENVQGVERTPVSGVLITVTQGDELIGSAFTDEAGRWEIPVPGPGLYTVELDASTLPEGLTLTDPNRSVLPNVEVGSSQRKIVRFNIGPGSISTVTNWSRVWGLFLIGLKLGSIIALSSIGLSLVYGVTRLVNFAHGDLVTLGAMLAFLFSASALGPGWHIMIAAVPAVMLAGGFGAAQELLLWRPLRRRRVGTISLIVISIGLSFAIRYLILVAFAGLPRPYRSYAVQKPIDFLGASIVPKSLLIVVISAAILVGVGLFLMNSRMGTAMRAVSDNSDLAESSGIDVNRVILVTWVLGAGLAAVGGIMLGISEAVQWDMGGRMLLLMFAAVILGGLGTAFGAMLGGFVIGILVEMSTLFLPVEFKTAVALGILVVMLLVRPQGLLGVRERIG